MTSAPVPRVPDAAVRRSIDLSLRVARLRYEVYCVERGFLDPAGYPAGYEVDEYDQVSVPVAVEHRGAVVAALRLVLDSPLGFPLEARARALSPAYSRVDRTRAAEISRLVVARAYRREAPPARVGASCPALLRLFRALYAESRRLGLTCWLAAMEPALARRLRHLVGIEFVAVGGAMDYYGEVVPYGASIRDVERTLTRRRPALARYFGMPIGAECASRRGSREYPGSEETRAPWSSAGTD